MKLFWKEQTPLLAFYALQALLVPLLYSLLDVRFDGAFVLYGLLLSLAVLAAYLLFRYLTHRNFYRQLGDDENPDLAERENIPSFRGDGGTAPLPEALNRLLLRQEKRCLDELSREKNRMELHLAFMNRWVHQMKTPVSVLQLTAAEMDSEAGDSIIEELERIKKGLEMVLYTARLERFEQDFAIRPISLRETAAQAVKENRRLFIRKGVRPELRIGEGVRVYSDGKWLLFLLGQILTNAVNYSGGPGKTVIIEAREQEGTSGASVTELIVQDEGIGIAVEDLRRVFSPYFTGERGREYTESTGMGLYLVKEICTRLGHEVSIASQPGIGTTVSIRFPHPPPQSSE